MTLSETPFENLQIGNRVKSLLTGRLGTIERLIPKMKAKLARDHEIVIRWDERELLSHTWQFVYNNVEII